jgi:hypothetical protein
MSIFDHPGFMYYGDFGIEVLHADWPAYPAGHGRNTAIKALAVFPSDVRFIQIDDIDQCLLFVATGSGSCLDPKGDLTDPKWFHVAVWRDDLNELHKQGLISGVSQITAYEAALRYYERHKDLYVRFNGELRPLNLPYPQPEQFDEDEPTVAQISAQGIAVTAAGADILVSLARSLGDLEIDIRRRAEPLLSIPLYDTAIREAGIILETRLREITASTSFGQALIEEYYKLLCSRYGGKPRSIFKILRGELRTIFKFIRNDFAHALRDISSSQCRVLLDRTSSALEAINQIEVAERADVEST